MRNRDDVGLLLEELQALTLRSTAILQRIETARSNERTERPAPTDGRNPSPGHQPPARPSTTRALRIGTRVIFKSTRVGRLTGKNAPDDLHGKILAFTEKRAYILSNNGDKVYRDPKNIRVDTAYVH